MVRSCVCWLFFVVACSVPPAAEAQPISRNNPWRTGTLSGINYGSMTWEQQHRKSGGNNYYYRSRRR